MKRTHGVLLSGALLLGTLGMTARAEFPKEVDEPLKFDERFSDKNSQARKDLEEGKLTPDAIAIHDGDITYFQLDYSEIMTIPLETLKLGIGDFEAYPCYMPKIKPGAAIEPPGLKNSKGEVISNTDLEKKLWTTHFKLDLKLAVFDYYLDIRTRIEDAKTYGTSWVQNFGMHKERLPEIFDPFSNHVGSWYVEYFDKDANGKDRYYVRYRDTIQLKWKLNEAAYRKKVSENAKLMFAAGKAEKLGLYNYNRDCLKKFKTEVESETRD